MVPALKPLANNNPGSYQPRSRIASIALENGFKRELLDACPRGANGRPDINAYVKSLEPVSEGRSKRHRKWIESTGSSECRKLPAWEMPLMYKIISGLSVKVGLKKPPELCIFETSQPVATSYLSMFGGLRLLAFGSGLLDDYFSGKFSLGEVEAVIVHELAHAKKNHTLKYSVCHSALTYGPWIAVIGIGVLSHSSVPLAIATFVLDAFLLSFKKELLNAVRHSFEFACDKSAALIAGARNISSYLGKMQEIRRGLGLEPDGSISFSIRRGNFANYLLRFEDSHPPRSERIARVEKLIKAQDAIQGLPASE